MGNSPRTTISSLNHHLASWLSQPRRLSKRQNWVQADKPQFGDTFLFSIGGMTQQANVTFSGTREGLPEVKLDMDDLGMDSSASTIWAGFTWQFADK
jgi:hypothetical protein